VAYVNGHFGGNMELFHFMKKEHAINCIKKSQLKVATLENMNDPYEFHILLDDYTSDEADAFFKQHFNDKLGFLCFSNNLENPLQWAHYSDNHRGVCLGFEIPDNLLQKITYLEQPKQISSQNENFETEITSMTLNKYKGWSYEEEFRIPVQLEKTINENGLYFASLIGALKVTSVFTGLRCKLSIQEKKAIEFNKIPIVPMVQDSTSYSIVRA
jgi:hypothetical protein